jgi:hypothetical protein
MNMILERVFNVCKSVRESVQDLITFKKLIARSRKTFKKHKLDLVLKTKKDKDLDWDNWYVMAYYDSEDDLAGETPIEVIVYHNLGGTEELGVHQVTLFLTEIYDAVVHEYRHQYQSMRRNFCHYETTPVTPYDEYLSDQDELDAYAVSIAIELLRTMDTHRALRNLSRISKMSKMRTGPKLSSPMLRAYIQHFGLNPTTKRLAKKVYRHLNSIDKSFIFM